MRLICFNGTELITAAEAAAISQRSAKGTRLNAGKCSPEKNRPSRPALVIAVVLALSVDMGTEGCVPRGSMLFTPAFLSGHEGGVSLNVQSENF